MSQEQPPIRSRRELRKARDAQPPVSAGAEQLSPAANRPAAGSSVPGTAAAPEQTFTQRSSQVRARDRAALRTIKELEEKEGQLAAGGPPTRRQLRLQQLKEQTLTAANPIVPPASVRADAAAPEPGDGGRSVGERATQGGRTNPSVAERGSAAPEGMTVEQALAARSLLAEQAKNQIAKMEHIASLDPEAVDPEILAEQIALAERAAILNRRALAKQKLAEQAGAPPVPTKDPAPGPAQDAGTREQAGAAYQRPAPSTASNLAMVTPLEFVQVPGIDRPVMKPPATSHVPVATRPGSKVTAPGTKKRRPAGSQRPAAADAGSGRSQVIARAEAAARSAARPRPLMTDENQAEDLFEDLPRVPAKSAYGLDPLDAATAGLARARRNRVLQFCILAFGIVALVSGIILIISGMSR